MSAPGPDPRRAALRLGALERAIPNCERCPELRSYTAEIARVRRRAYAGETYHGRPVPGFGDPAARCVLVGLAPGAHGSNRTGRMFTGDASGVWLYRALYRAGLANRPEAVALGDGLELVDCYITAALRCAPPDNRPTPSQLLACAPYLDEEFALLRRARVVVGLGAIGTKAAIAAMRRCGFGVPAFTFAHGARCEVRLPPGRDEAAGTAAPTGTLIATYHPSRQNTNTRRLTEPMFDDVFARVRATLDVSVR